MLTASLTSKTDQRCIASEMALPILAPVRLARVNGVRPVEVRRIEIAVVEHEALFMEKWHEHTRN